MQSNETEREAQNNDPAKEIVLIMRKHGLRLSSGNGEDGPGDMYTAAREILAREHHKTLQARIDELKSFARDFVVQHGVVPARSVSVKKLSDRILELQSQLPKDKGEEYA